MDSETHGKARDLFFEALDLPPELNVHLWLDEQCGDDPALVAAVKRLLDSNAKETRFMPESGAIRDSTLRKHVREVVSDVSGLHLNPDGGRSGSVAPRWSPPAYQEIDDLLLSYEVTGMLGCGGMGAVYRGNQISLERPVAIKILPSEFDSEDPSFAARFRREALSMARLDHPNIVTIYDFGSVETGSGGRLYFIVMEFVSGTDLHRLIAGGKLHSTAALDVVSQICDALQYAHDHGYVHRDVKPANIFVSEEGVVKVGDFGLAKLCASTEENESLNHITLSGYYLGTPQYMAPEATRGDHGFDHRADIYSLGVMFYEMLTGAIPRGTFKPPSAKTVGVDERLDEIVLKAMRDQPEDRYQQAGEVKADITRVSTTKVSRQERKPAKPGRLARCVVLALLIMVGVGFVPGFFEGEKIPNTIAALPIGTPGESVASILPVGAENEVSEPLDIQPPNPMAMPKGRLGFWSGEEGKPLEPGGADRFSDFVDVQLYQSTGWVALRENGQAYRWLRNARMDASPLHENLLALNRTSNFAVGPYLAANGRLVDRDTGTELETPKEIVRRLIDYAIANSEDAEPAYLTDDGRIHHSHAPDGLFKQIGNWDEWLLGLKVDGELVAWAGNGESVPDLSGTKVSKFSAVAGVAIGLTIEGVPVIFGPSRRIEPLPEEIESERFVDVVCGRFVYAGRRPDGTWKAWGADEEKIGTVCEVIEQLGPKVSTLSIKSTYLAWIEEISVAAE